jgi:hypothetical protein
MHCWVHQDALLNEEQTETDMREAWEHEGSKDELNIVLHGLEQHFWKGREESGKLLNRRERDGGNPRAERGATN